MSGFKHLRVEEAPPPALTPKTAAVGRVVQITTPQPVAAEPAKKDLEYWRSLAVQNGERLQLAESQAKDLREAADEGRGRFSKYKQRLDSANARINELQIQLTRVSAERDALKARDVDLDRANAEIAALRARMPRVEYLKREIHAFRQSILDGHIWNVFSELCDVSAAAGEENKQP